nr:Chain E, ALA-ARG-THR-GLU-LEU-TYR-ARG-SER-LEU [synthetic construct]5W6A_F Chain F, ALA-ARG-THR-GLU-LEU-TYR-ARG-SER-LEU [synthetic construct]
ARTELYRSL